MQRESFPRNVAQCHCQSHSDELVEGVYKLVDGVYEVVEAVHNLVEDVHELVDCVYNPVTVFTISLKMFTTLVEGVHEVVVIVIKAHDRQ